MSSLVTIARIHSAFPEKFGVPRQSGLINDLHATIVFEPEYRSADAIRGLEAFSHIWLLWAFSASQRDSWSPTVRPPRLGGNERMGVFATRSPYRPNAIGLSSVKLDGIESHTSLGPVLHVLGADMMDDTPIYDIKPYLPYTDSHLDAVGGFADTPPERRLEVVVADGWLAVLTEPGDRSLLDVLALDPRPAYQCDPERVYGLRFGAYNIRFTIDENTLTVCEIRRVDA